MVGSRVIGSLRPGHRLRVFLVLLDLDVEVAIFVIKGLDMLVQLVLASLVRALQNVALALSTVVPAWPQMRVPSSAAESLVQDLGVVV